MASDPRDEPRYSQRQVDEMMEQLSKDLRVMQVYQQTESGYAVLQIVRVMSEFDGQTVVVR